MNFNAPDLGPGELHEAGNFVRGQATEDLFAGPQMQEFGRAGATPCYFIAQQRKRFWRAGAAGCAQCKFSLSRIPALAEFFVNRIR